MGDREQAPPPPDAANTPAPISIGGTRTSAERGVWPHILDFFFTLWVLRASVAVLVIGAVLMWFVPQAQDLLIELAMPASLADWGRIVLFFLGLLVIWAMPTHYAARLLIRSDEGYLRRIDTRGTAWIKGLQKWSPRVLGALTFVVMLGGVWRAWYNRPQFSDAQEFPGLGWHLLIVALGLVATGIVFWLYAVYRERADATSLVVASERFAGNVMAPLRRVLPAITATRQAGTSNLGPLLLLLMFFGFVALPMAAPLWFAEYLPRALSVPFVLGGWLPLLAYLSGLGRRVHAPFILGGIVLLTLLPLIFGDNYAIRRIDWAQGGAKSRYVELKDAIDWWKKFNCNNSGCPRPIIIAAAGGASRAGFFTASVIGQLLDDQLRVDGKGHNLAAAAMANRIFALSTVSGSSVGAVMSVAAIAASQNGAQPCNGNTQPLWDGSKINSWRSCFEALTSGDFLTPIFTGFVFRDMFGFFKWQDRGTLLERAVEEQFASLVTKPQNPGKLACIGSLTCPFTSLRPTPDHWVPILLLNTTSVKTGQRVIETTLEWHIELADNRNCPNNIRELSCEIFLHGANFFDWQGKDPNPKKDLRLSTAAHNSARFPLLSPPGSIVDAKGHIVDRLVDGGYFENFGVQTATELARAIHALDPQLNPFILILSNDPEVLRHNPQQSSSQNPKARQAQSATADSSDSGSTLLPDLFGPLGAFVETRSARGVLALEGAAVALDHENSSQCNTSWVRVWSEPNPHDKSRAKARPLSMSWWLSKPVQRYLREQTEFVGGQSMNRHENKDRIKGLLDAIANVYLQRPKAGEVQCESEED